MVTDLRLKSWLRRTAFALLLPALHAQPPTALAFEGRIIATLDRGGDLQTLLYTVGANQIRIERGETNRLYPENLLNLTTGDITLLFPHNRSFVRLTTVKSAAGGPFPPGPGMPIPAAGLPSGAGSRKTGGAALESTAMPAVIGPTNPAGTPTASNIPRRLSSPKAPPGVGPQSNPGIPAMPLIPPMPAEQTEFKTTTDSTNLFGYICTRYELKQRDEVMDVWATDKLVPFEPYLQSQPPPSGPEMLEDRWGEMLKARKLFPLLAVLRFVPPPVSAGATPLPEGPERLRFEVKSVTPKKFDDRNRELFQPPPDYQEIQPLPF